MKLNNLPRHLALLPAMGLSLLAATLLTGCPEGKDPAQQRAHEQNGGEPAAHSISDEPLPATLVEAANVIDTESLREVTAYLSSDEMAGRGPATEGDRKARTYIAERLAAAGFQPGAADGGWQQPFEVVSITSEAPPTWTFKTADGSARDFKFWDEYIASSGVQEPTARVENAEVVFVGYGIEAPEYGWDDYKDADLQGKVLLMLNNDPDWDPALFEGDRRLYYGRWTYKYESAAGQGAAGAIIIHTRPSAGYPWQVVQTSWTGPQFELPAAGEARIQVAGWLTWDAALELVAMAGKDLAELEKAAHGKDFAPVPLGVTTSLQLTNKIERVETGNVVGVLRGVDPALADEAVVFTAHHDHLGTGEAQSEGEDVIYNGARDNAAGVAQVIAIAEAFTALPEPPRRSVVMLLVGGEEQGLLGSKFYARHPTFPAGRIAANINFDAPGIWGRTRDLPLIGLGKSSLDEVARWAAAHQGRTVVGEPDPTQGSFYRSDQLSFAKIGVPALYFSEGTDFVDASKGLSEEDLEAWNSTHYHQPSDELTDDWDLSGAVEDAQAGFFCGWAVAQEEQLPAWNPGDEFEAARKEALAAVQ